MTKRGRPPHPDILTPAEWRVVEGVWHGLTIPAIQKFEDADGNMLAIMGFVPR